MLCLSDFQLSSLLFSKMVPRCMRKGYGSVTLATGKKVLDPDLCVCMALQLLADLCGNDVSFWPISAWPMSFLCHCLWSSVFSLTKPHWSSLADWLLSSCGHHRHSWGSASSSTQPLDNLTLCPSPSQAPLQTHRLSPQWHSKHALTQRHEGPSRSYPRYTKTSIIQEKQTLVLPLQIMVPNQVSSDVTPTGWGSTTFEASSFQSANRSKPTSDSP